MPTPTDQLDLPADVLARRQALQQLSDVTEAAQRLRTQRCGESLHDFCFTLRRLRSFLSTWRDTLAPDIRATHRQAAERIQEQTSANWDANIMLSWLRQHEAYFSEHQQPGCER